MNQVMKILQESSYGKFPQGPSYGNPIGIKHKKRSRKRVKFSQKPTWEIIKKKEGFNTFRLFQVTQYDNYGSLFLLQVAQNQLHKIRQPWEGLKTKEGVQHAIAFKLQSKYENYQS